MSLLFFYIFSVFIFIVTPGPIAMLVCKNATHSLKKRVFDDNRHKFIIIDLDWSCDGYDFGRSYDFAEFIGLALVFRRWRAYFRHQKQR